MSFRAIFPWKTNYKTMFTDIVQWYYETPQDFPVNTSQLQVAGGFWSLLWWREKFTGRYAKLPTMQYFSLNYFCRLCSK